MEKNKWPILGRKWMSLQKNSLNFLVENHATNHFCPFLKLGLQALACWPFSLHSSAVFLPLLADLPRFLLPMQRLALYLWPPDSSFYRPTCPPRQQVLFSSWIECPPGGICVPNADNIFMNSVSLATSVCNWWSDAFCWKLWGRPSTSLSEPCSPQGSVAGKKLGQIILKVESSVNHSLLCFFSKTVATFSFETPTSPQAEVRQNICNVCLHVSV